MRLTANRPIVKFGWLLACMSMAPCLAKSPSEHRAALVDVLRRAMVSEQGWVRIHAADAMIEHGYLDEVASAFTTMADTTPPPQRIGVWRVLAASATQKESRQRHIDRVRAAMLDEAAVDRVTAAETLAKLNAGDPADRPLLERWIASAPDADDAMPLWLMAQKATDEERTGDESRLASLLGSSDPVARLRAAFALGRLSRIGPAALRSVRDRLAIEPADSPARVHLLIAAMMHDSAGRAALKPALAESLRDAKPNERLAAATALGMIGDVSDLALLGPLLESTDGDTRIGAADGSLRILRRSHHSMAALDWVVIAIYLIGMLGIGAHYSRTNESREEYLLGGRRMKPWAVGLSYFATIFSTITYMSWPGEIVKNGPMLLGQVIGFPVAVALVGWFIIPFIMRLPVTSAYEILEMRLGLSVRLLGSTFFLLMRVFWMSVILYTSTTQILVPVAGLDPSDALAVAAIMGLITVVYTSMGGFKAVVFTDVTQTVVLFGGALATIVGVTVYFGGLSWIPTRWEPTWQKPVLGFDPSARITLASALMSMLVWQVCTAGSDQMAIQRYLSTRDAPAARRMYITAMSANALVFFLLTALGLCLLAYFKARPDMLNAGQSMTTNADMLFSQYVVFGLPSGATGLVIAGLLAAAMSSLSSGLSSCSAVITVDFIQRFGSAGKAEVENSRTARLITWAIGVAIVLLSSVVGAVQGNLLEMTFKIVNLLTAPLAGLFFMAMFVRRATVLGTWTGAVIGTTTIVLILFWKDFTGRDGIGFMWSMPLCIVSQLLTGTLASFLPIGKSAPMIGGAPTE
jgi:SSS family solute:Na+ symporter